MIKVLMPGDSKLLSQLDFNTKKENDEKELRSVMIFLLSYLKIHIIKI